MARGDKQAPDSPQGITLELRGRSDTERPEFSNLVISNVFNIEDSQPLLTLTFIHVYPLPVDQHESQPRGDVVARVTMTPHAAKSLRDLLIRQHPLNKSEFTALRKSAGSA